MSSRIDFFKESFTTAIGGIEPFVVVYVLILAGFIILKKKELKQYFSYPLIFMLLTVYNPFIIVWVAEKIGLTSRIRRIFWLMPINLVLAVAAVFLIKRFKKTWLRVLMAAVLAVAVVLGGTPAIPEMKKAENIYKVKNETIEISRIIEEDAGTDGYKKAAFADVAMLELRQYDPSIRNLLNRKIMYSWNPDVSDGKVVERIKKKVTKRKYQVALVIKYGITIDEELFKKCIQKKKVEYLIPNKGLGLDDYLLRMGYENVGETENFVVYRTNIVME